MNKSQIDMVKTLLQTIAFSLITITSFANNLNEYKALNEKNNFLNPCDVIITPGEIGTSQVVCINDNTPLKLEEITAPTGNLDGYEFLWIYTNTDPSAQTIVWFPINSATEKSYQPEPAFETVWYRRCVRPVGCDVYTAESNIIKIEVDDCAVDCSLFTTNISVVEDITCFGEVDGSVQVEMNGGLAPFSYEWSHSNIQSDIATNIGEGTYSVTVTDANDCTSVATVSLKAPDALSVSYDIFPETCAGEDGAIFINVSGGVAPYSFLWGNGFGTNAFLENLSAGHYVVWIQDANGCKTATEMTVAKECDPLIIDFDDKGLQNVGDEAVVVHWVSENEQDGGTYIVEKSRNNIDFNILCSMTGQGFETNGKAYTCIDENPFEGTSFYRIVHVSPEAGKTISTSQSVYVENEGLSKVLIYPNPVVETVSVNFLKPTQTETTIRVFNQTGNTIQSVTVENGQTIQNLNLSGIPAGQYTIYVEKEGQRPETHRIFKGE